MDCSIGLWNGARERKHQRESMLGDADGVAAGRIHYQDAAACGRVHVHVVHANSGASYHAQALGFVEKFCRNACGATHDKAISGGEFV